MTRLAIVEDNQDIKNSIVEFFSMLEGYEITHTAISVEEFLKKSVMAEKPDVILLDINLPGMTGIDGISFIKALYPEAEILMLTIYTDSEHIFQALCKGASGYLVKNTPLPKLKDNIEDMRNGGAAITPAIAKKVIEYFRPGRRAFPETLTNRERDIIDGIVDGLSYKLVADRLGISTETVRTLIKRIYKKLQINSKAELISKFHHGTV
jgi:DNA-binding NarL/FixJ family response regulator